MDHPGEQHQRHDRIRRQIDPTANRARLIGAVAWKGRHDVQEQERGEGDKKLGQFGGLVGSNKGVLCPAAGRFALRLCISGCPKATGMRNGAYLEALDFSAMTPRAAVSHTNSFRRPPMTSP